jgi:diguanylate cyclase (GGDEF)-like protein
MDLLDRYDVRARAVLATAGPAGVALLLLATDPGAAQARWVPLLQLISAGLFLLVGTVVLRRTVSAGQLTGFSVGATAILVLLALTLTDDVLRLVTALAVLVMPLYTAVFAGVRAAVGHAGAAVVGAVLLVEHLAPAGGTGPARVIGVVLLVAAPTAFTLLLRHRLDTALRRAEVLATTDPLTGLLNRRGMLERSSPLIAAARRDGQQVAVLVADVDHLKQVNDSRGHLCGDEVLRMVADEIRAACREPDLVVRLGGEEVVVVMAVSAPGEVLTCAERIRLAVRSGAGRRAGLPSVTISVGGVVGSPPHLLPGDEAGRWLHHRMDEADDRMHEAKRAGRDRVVLGVPRESQPA